jgi:putative membrane protein insertion efficiency factor
LATNLLSPPPKVTYPVEYGNESELKKGAKLMFTFYKRYISSQDVQSCNFSPSCSVYAMHAIEKKGMFSGFFLTFDRLTRCHPLGANYYPKDPETGLWLDPVTP